MFKLHKDEASRRMASLNEILEKNGAQWMAASLKVSVSFGVSGFESLNGLGRAIEQADKAMYGRRKKIRNLAEPSPVIPGLK